MSLRPSALQQALAADAILSGQAQTMDADCCSSASMIKPIGLTEQLLSAASIIRGPNALADKFFGPPGLSTGITAVSNWSLETVFHTSRTVAEECFVRVGRSFAPFHVESLVTSSLVDAVSLASVWLVTNETPNSSRANRSTLLRYLRLVLEHHNTLGSATSAALARQLRGLLSDEDELEEYAIKPQRDSFEGLLKFLASRQPLHPNLSINRDGQFVASWSPTAKRKLALTFTSDVGGCWSGVSLVDPKTSGRENFETVTFALPEPFANWM